MIKLELGGISEVGEAESTGLQYVAEHVLSVWHDYLDLLARLPRDPTFLDPPDCGQTYALLLWFPASRQSSCILHPTHLFMAVHPNYPGLTAEVTRFEYPYKPEYRDANEDPQRDPVVRYIAVKQDGDYFEVRFHVPRSCFEHYHVVARLLIDGKRMRNTICKKDEPASYGGWSETFFTSMFHKDGTDFKQDFRFWDLKTSEFSGKSSLWFKLSLHSQLRIWTQSMMKRRITSQVQAKLSYSFTMW